MYWSAWSKPKNKTTTLCSRQDSNVRGEIPVDFALTTRPRLLRQCLLQLSLVKSLFPEAYQVISSCSLRNDTSLISDNVYHFDLRSTYIALLGIVKKGWRERESILHAGVIPNKVIHVKLFLDHFRLHKSFALKNFLTESLSFKKLYKEDLTTFKLHHRFSLALRMRSEED